jgi:hypothetical protein
MKKSIVLLFIISVQIAYCQENDENDGPQNRARRVAYINKLITPPNATEVPYESFLEGNKRVDRQFAEKAKKLKNGKAIPNILWTERGPNNIGGRTRAIMFDPNTTNKVWAGGAAGGLWYNNNITDANSSWFKINDFWDNITVSTIARASNSTQVFYVGTGERQPGGGDRVNGGGIWRTLDGGSTWTHLQSTLPSTDVNFRYIQKIVVSGSGRVWAACFGGLMFSDNQGETWSEVATSFTDDIEYRNYFDDMEIAPLNIVFASSRNGQSGNSRIFQLTETSVSPFYTITDTTPTYTGVGYRIELGLAPSTAGNTLNIYAICIGGTNVNNDVLWFKKSTNAAVNWTDVTIPTYQRNGVGPIKSFTNGVGNQGDYNLAIAVHPTNPNLVLLGGVTNARSTNGGTSWVVDNYGAKLHPDIHNIQFAPTDYNSVLYSNDGGLAWSTNYGDATNNSYSFEARNKNYNVTEFYKVAIKNVASDNYIVAGAQDNGTISMNGSSIQSGTDITGSDGAFCFIDQDDPSIKIVSIQNLNHYLHNETTNTNSNLLNVANGEGFINPCDYDSQSNQFYSFFKRGAGGFLFYRISNVGSTNTQTQFSVGIDTTGVGVTMIKVGKAANTIFVGTSGGRLYRVSTSDIAATTFTEITQGNVNSTPSTPRQGTIFSIDIGVDDNELIMVKTNYGIRSVFYTNNGGTNWICKDLVDHGLPDMPVWAALFNPLNRNQVLLATEFGMWSTMNITAANPEWEPTDANLAHVRCMAFAYRSADNLVAVATHGRGVFTTTLTAQCLENRFYTLVIPKGSAHYDASSTITVSVPLPADQLISLDAGLKVSLKPGFKVQAGTKLKAYIDGCGGVR